MVESTTLIYHEATDEDIPQILMVIKAAFAEYEGRLDPPSSAERKTVAIVREELMGAVNGVFGEENGRTWFEKSHPLRQDCLARESGLLSKIGI